MDDFLTAVLTIGLADAATAATLTWSGLPESGEGRTASRTFGLVIGNDATDIVGKRLVP